MPAEEVAAHYYVENNHEAIIDPDPFEMVQRELQRRVAGKNRHSGVHLLSGKIKCGDCGGWYGSKVWHSPEKYKRIVWQCNQKCKNEKRCTTPFLDENDVRARFVQAANQLLSGREEAIAAYEAAQAVALDTGPLEKEKTELLAELEVTAGLIQQLVRQNATTTMDQAEFQSQYDTLSERYHNAEERKKQISAELSDIAFRRGTMDDFIHSLRTEDGKLTEFKEDTWSRLLDYATAYADGRLVFNFKNGQTFEA